MQNVVSLTGGNATSERRASFAQAAAIAFDRYVADLGYEPDALVFVLGGITQAATISWDVRGESERGVASLLSTAAAQMLGAAQRANQGLPE